MRSNLKLQAARYRLGCVTGDDLVRTADRSLSDGLESESLVLLAISTDPVLPEVAPLFEKALFELGVGLPTAEDAYRAVVGHHFSSIASGCVKPLDGIKALLEDLGRWSEEWAEECFGIRGVILLFWGAVELGSQPAGTMSFEGMVGEDAMDAVAKRIRKQAQEWLSTHGT